MHAGQIARIFAVPREPTTRTVSRGFSFTGFLIADLVGALSKVVVKHCHVSFYFRFLLTAAPRHLATRGSVPW